MTDDIWKAMQETPISPDIKEYVSHYPLSKKVPSLLPVVETPRDTSITIKLPRELVDVTQRNYEAVLPKVPGSRTFFIEPMDEEEAMSLPYQDFMASADEKNTKILPPSVDVPGLSMKQWRMMLTAAVSLFERGLPITVSQICNSNARINRKLCEKAIVHPDFGRALEMRGVTTPAMGLSEEQMLLLSVLTDYTDKASFATKLRRLGIPSWKYKAWQANPVFKHALRQASEQVFEDAQAAVNMSLVHNATHGDLASQKYFNELSGRWNPAEQSSVDVKTVLTAVVEVLNSTITDPDLLREIAGKLATISVVHGGTSPGNVVNPSPMIAQGKVM